MDVFGLHLGELDASGFPFCLPILCYEPQMGSLSNAHTYPKLLRFIPQSTVIFIFGELERRAWIRTRISHQEWWAFCLNYQRIEPEVHSNVFMMWRSAWVTFSPLYIPAPSSSILENGISGTVSFARQARSMK